MIGQFPIEYKLYFKKPPELRNEPRALKYFASIFIKLILYQQNEMCYAHDLLHTNV